MNYKRLREKSLFQRIDDTYYRLYYPLLNILIRRKNESKNRVDSLSKQYKRRLYAFYSCPLKYKTLQKKRLDDISLEFEKAIALYEEQVEFCNNTWAAEPALRKAWLLAYDQFKENINV